MTAARLPRHLQRRARKQRLQGNNRRDNVETKESITHESISQVTTTSTSTTSQMKKPTSKFTSTSTSLLNDIITYLRQHVSRQGISPDDETRLECDSRHGLHESSSFHDCDAITAYMIDDFLYDIHARTQMVIHDQLAIFYCEMCRHIIYTPWRDGKWHVYVRDEEKENNTMYITRSTSTSTTSTPSHILTGDIPIPSSCPHCHSCHITRRTHITHSLCIKQLHDMYDMLKDILTEESCVVDVGSRLGNVLYTGYAWTRAHFIGIEYNDWFSCLSHDIIHTFDMSDRIRIISGDVRNHGRILSSAYVIIFFNPFELHWSHEEHTQLLIWFTHVTSSGCYILSCPSLIEIYERAAVDVDVNEWIELISSKEDAFLFRVK